MKKLIYFCLILATSLTLGCKKKEKRNLYSTYVRVLADVKSRSNTNVNVYKSEIDFWAGKNELMSGITNENGEFFIQKNQPQPDYTSYWVKVNYNELNNYREGKFKVISEYEKQEIDQLRTRYTRTYEAFLETTPTNLQLRVYNNGLPVQGAKVYLYDSEVSYYNKNNYKFNYFIYSNSVKYDSYTSFYILTDESGIANIKNLEPKQYWFRIEKDGKTNTTNKIVTDGALPDDINITSILDIAIN